MTALPTSTPGSSPGSTHDDAPDRPSRLNFGPRGALSPATAPQTSESESESEDGDEAVEPSSTEYEETILMSARKRAARLAAKAEYWQKRPPTSGGARWADAHVPPVPITGRRGLSPGLILAPPPILEAAAEACEPIPTVRASPITRASAVRVRAAVMSVCFAGIMLRRFRAKQAAEKLKRGPSLTEKGGVVPLKWLNEIDPTRAEQVQQGTTDADLYQRYLKLQTMPEEDLSVSRLELLLTNYPALWLAAPLLVGLYILVVWYSGSNVPEGVKSAQEL
eukprot:COSAG05_NODE_356_length_10852_cov_10.168418_4_plen_279_part_00